MIAVREKQDNVKKASLIKKSNNNAQKLKKSCEKWVKHTKNNKKNIGLVSSVHQ